MEAPPIDFQSDLNKQQFAAATSGDHPSLVLAGAGTGKTRVLTYRVAYLLRQGVDPGRILLLTFTNKAAREMLSRVEELTGFPRYDFWGGTFHSIGQRMLRMHGEPLGMDPNYTILDRSDSESLLADVIDEVIPGYLKNKLNPKAKLIGNVIGLSRNTCKSMDEVVMKFYPYLLEHLPEFVQFSETYSKSKLRQQVADFDDLLVFWLQILQTQKEVARYYQETFSAYFDR